MNVLGAVESFGLLSRDLEEIAGLTSNLSDDELIIKWYLCYTEAAEMSRIFGCDRRNPRFKELQNLQMVYQESIEFVRGIGLEGAWKRIRQLTNINEKFKEVRD